MKTITLSEPEAGKLWIALQAYNTSETRKTQQFAETMLAEGMNAKEVKEWRENKEKYLAEYAALAYKIYQEAVLGNVDR